MRLIKFALFLFGLIAGSAAFAQTLPTPTPVPSPQNSLHLELSTGGVVVIDLRPDKAPNHIERIKALTRSGFYDGLLFHRVIEGFMAQTGDPTGTGSGDSPLPDLKAEFNDLPHFRGAVSMARTDDPDSANSQFFIVFQPVMRLDGKYTVFGRVVSGMQFVDAIVRGEPPPTPSKIVRAWIEADGRDAQRVALVIPPPMPKPLPAASPPPVVEPVVAAVVETPKKGGKPKRDKKKSKE